MICGSLFSGAGLLDAGLHQAGHEHAWFVERDEFRRGLLGRRWPGRPVHDDVRTVGIDNLEPVECVAGGFPCKGASTAGKRTGLAHPETALWAEFYRIVGELRPRYVVIENVANILALHDGAVWGTVLGDLAALGFDVAWDCVPAAAFGAPHGRDRVVAIARHAEGASGQGAWTGREALGRVGAAGDGADVASDASLVGHGRGWRAWSGRDGLADGGQAAADAEHATRDGQFLGAQDGLPGRSDGAGHRGVPVEWGEYEPAIRRWEAIHGPAPEPLVRRLDARRADLSDVQKRLDRPAMRAQRARLSALGDGVQVQLARLVGEALNELETAP